MLACKYSPNIYAPASSCEKSADLFTLFEEDSLDFCDMEIPIDAQVEHRPELRDVELQSQCDDEYRWHYNFLPFCFSQHLFTSTRLVGYLSIFSLFVNLLLIIFGNGSQSMSQLFFELGLVLIEFVVIVALFHGVSHQSPEHLKPFLVFGVVWNFALFILWIFCLIETLQQKEEFIMEVLINASHFISLDTSPGKHKVGFWLSIGLLAGLGFIILFGFWFLNIVLLTYFSLKRNQKLCSLSDAETTLLPKPSLMEDSTKAHSNYLFTKANKNIQTA
ncbi:hypothetical protein Ddc_05580 [Ditylenchus destructor]|nr:hypothetical protein Ddc_05580 [Ditylenchus destructor]